MKNILKLVFFFFLRKKVCVRNKNLASRNSFCKQMHTCWRAGLFKPFFSPCSFWFSRNRMNFELFVEGRKGDFSSNSLAAIVQFFRAPFMQHNSNNETWMKLEGGWLRVTSTLASSFLNNEIFTTLDCKLVSSILKFHFTLTHLTDPPRLTFYSRRSEKREILTIAPLCQRHNAQDVDGTMKKMYINLMYERTTWKWRRKYMI